MTDGLRLREVQVPEWTVTTEGEGFRFCFVSCCDGDLYVPAATTGIRCPFCGEDDYDTIGLKSHLTSGGCATFNNLPDLFRPFAVKA